MQCDKTDGVACLLKNLQVIYIVKAAGYGVQNETFFLSCMYFYGIFNFYIKTVF